MSAVRVTYRKSVIGYSKDQRATLVALGLKKLNHSVDHEGTPSIIGMIHKVRHLVAVDGTPADTPAGVAVLAAVAGGTKTETAE